MRIGRATLLLCLSAAVGSCTAAHDATGANDGPQFSCCLGSDIGRAYHPGDIVTLHWIVTPARDPANAPHDQIELTARIDGAYSNAATLKSTVSNEPTTVTFTINANPIHPSGAPGEQPTSTLVIPPTVAPGFYNLQWSVNDGGNTVTATSVIRVVAS